MVPSFSVLSWLRSSLGCRVGLRRRRIGGEAGTGPNRVATSIRVWWCWRLRSRCSRTPGAGCGLPHAYRRAMRLGAGGWGEVSSRPFGVVGLWVRAVRPVATRISSRPADRTLFAAASPSRAEVRTSPQRRRIADAAFGYTRRAVLRERHDRLSAREARAFRGVGRRARADLSWSTKSLVVRSALNTSSLLLETYC
jgi:hypothetical protein